MNRTGGVWFAPGRVNLMGGPDYNETFVLPFALGAGVYATASRRSDGRIALTSRQAADEGRTVLPIDGLEPGVVGGWVAYPAGVAWALREAGYLGGGADVAIDADLPAGAGLSSSAALECAVALALTGLYEVPVARRELAALARRAENEFCGVPSGMMDQLAALLGRAGHALLLDCRAGTVEPVPFDPGSAGLTVLVIDTRVRHALGDGRYAERRRACAAGALAMGVRSLREVNGELDRLTDPALRRVCGHVVAETRRVLRAAELLRSGGGEAWAAVGALLTASHCSLRDRFGVSWPEADEAVAAVIDAGGVGARMTGGGFGGCVVALVASARVAEVRGAVTERFARHRWAAPGYLDGVPSAGGRRLRLGGSGEGRVSPWAIRCAAASASHGRQLAAGARRPRWARAALRDGSADGNASRCPSRKAMSSLTPGTSSPAASAAMALASAGPSPTGARLAGVTVAGSGNVWVRPSGRPGTGVPSRVTKAPSRAGLAGQDRQDSYLEGAPRPRHGQAGPFGQQGAEHRIAAERGDPGGVIALGAE